MCYPITYGYICVGRYAVYCFDTFIGEVSKHRSGWHFRTFTEPVFVSQIPADTRIGAVVQWPGLRDVSPLI